MTLTGHRDTSPSQKSHPDHRFAPNCSLIVPRAGVEDLALALQAVAGGGRGGLNQLLNHPMPVGHKDPCLREP